MLSVSVHPYRRTKLTRSEGRKLIKNNAQTAYSNTVVLLLLKMVDLTYRKDQDDVQRPIDTSTTNLMKSVAVGPKQLGRILKGLIAADILKDFSRSGHHVSCQLNLEPLQLLEPYVDKQKTAKKKKDAERSEKAREQRAAQRTHVERLIEHDQEEQRLASLGVFQLVAEAAL